MTVTAAQKRQLLDEYLRTPEGRQILVATMMPSLRLQLDYYGLYPRPRSRTAGPGEAVVSGPQIEVYESFTVSTRSADRFQLFKKAQDRLRVVFGSAMDRHLLGLVREATVPRNEPFPAGTWRRVVMNARTQKDLIVAGTLGESPDPNLRGIPFLQDAVPYTNEHIEPGLLYAFGPQEQVGVCHYDIELTNTSDPDDEAYTVDAKLTFAMRLADSPLGVAVYTWPWDTR